MNRLYYGDNLDVLRQHVPDASVDLIYLDPPFNSNASYNILFKSPAGGGTDASIEAFGDTWEWGPSASSALMDINQSGNHKLHVLMQAMKTAIGENAMMAYLAMMAVRLVELHRVLKPTGSLYLHCDPTASHYLKLVLDAVFGIEKCTNEIVWQRTNAKSHAYTRFPSAHDLVFLYRKGDTSVWHSPYLPHSEKLLKSHYSNVEEGTGRRYTLGDTLNPNPNRPNLTYEWNGQTRVWRWTKEKMQQMQEDGRLVYTSSGMPRQKRYLDEMDGTPVTDVWTDIPPINSQAQERLGYPTQKPIALLERIIAASSNPGDVVLDPFCGCGTAVDAAQKLGRQWLGIDVTHLAIGLIENRLNDGYNRNADGTPGPINAVWETIGVPKDKDSALRLAEEKPHDFQNWFCLKVGGYPLDGGRKGADKGIDGHFYPYKSARETETGVISVKAGRNIGPAMIRDLLGVMQRDGYAYGLFLSAYEPTRAMLADAASAGMIDGEFGRFPRLQIMTPADLFHGPGAKLPPLAPINRRAARVETRASHKPDAQGGLL